MNLVQMSFTASVLILVTMIIRSLLARSMPKKTFIALWAVVLIRLLIPYTISSPLSVYSIINNNPGAAKVIAETSLANILPISSALSDNWSSASSGSAVIPPSVWMIIWYTNCCFQTRRRRFGGNGVYYINEQAII